MSFVERGAAAHHRVPMPTAPAPTHTDLNSRRASIVLALALPADTVLYLLLPMHAAEFGLSLAEAGLLLAANRLVRIAGYAWVARFYARRGDRPVCMLAVAVAALCALGYATLSGLWALLPLRLLWGLCFAALNLSTQALATADPVGAARRTGRPRAFIAMGPVLALPLGALLAQATGARPIFFVLAAVALLGLSLRDGCLRCRIPWMRRRGASGAPAASMPGPSWKGSRWTGSSSSASPTSAATCCRAARWWWPAC